MPAQPQYSIPAGQAVKASLFLQDPVLSLNGGASGFRPAVTTDFVPAFNETSVPVISGSMGAITTGVFPANQNRKFLRVQALGSGGAVYLRYHPTSAASATNFNYALAAATTDLGLNGGVLNDEFYRGAVQMSGWIGAKWLIWEGT